MNSSTSSLSALKPAWTFKRNSISQKSGSINNGQLPTPDASPVIQKRVSQQYATISTSTSSKGRHSRIPDFSNPSFFDGPVANSKGERADRTPLSPTLLYEDHWDISVAEQRQSGKFSKTRELTFTIYVTTATHSLTLTRSKADLVAFDGALQSVQASNSPLAAILADIDPSTSPPRKRRPIFATISRTLGGSRFRSSQIQSPPSQNVEPAANSDHVHPPLAQLSSYLTDLGKAMPKDSPVWASFFAPRARDLQSERVERRVRKMRSDPNFMQRVSTYPGSPMVEDDSSRTKTSNTPTIDGRTKEEQDDSDSLKFMAAISRQLAGDSDDVPQSPTDADMVTAPSSAAALVPPTGYHTPEPSEMSTVHETVEEASPGGQSQEGDLDDTGKIPMPFPVQRRAQRKGKKAVRQTTLEDFHIIKVLGKGCAGKVMLVRHESSGKLYAIKAIHKHHVLAHRELLHTLTEQSVLKRVAQEGSNPFVVRLWWSFHNERNLFLVLDYHPGGDLATQLARWGRLGRDRTRFYCAEIAVGLVGLHHAGVIYRDLKPENVLIGADGHCILTDFGLSKQFERPEHFYHRPTGSLDEERSAHPPWMRSIGKAQSSPPMGSWSAPKRETTTTFCGTAEYLAPEVLVGDPYSYECDAWSFGTMLYEMLTGVTPFYADDHTSMYRRVLHEELEFDDRVLDPDTRSILRGLLQKTPNLRMTDDRVRKHPYFGMIDWQFVTTKRYIPPYIPALNPDDELDTSNFDDAFLTMSPVVIDPEEEAEGDTNSTADREPQAAFDKDGNDVFSGYSFRGDAESVVDVQSIDSNAMLDDDEIQDVVDELPLSPGRTHREEDNPSHSEIDISFGHSQSENGSQHGHSQQSTDPSSVGHVPEHNKDPVAPQAANLGASILSDVQASPIDEEHEEDWDFVDDNAESAIPTLRNGKRGTAASSSFFARGIPDKYVLAVKDAVRPTPRRTNSTRKGLSSFHSRLSSRSSSVEGVDALIGSSPLRKSETPMKMRFKRSRQSLKPTRNYSQDNLDTPSSSNSDDGLPPKSRSVFMLKKFANISPMKSNNTTSDT